MKINIILPFVHTGGGVRVMFEHCIGLTSLGHDLMIYYPGGQGAEKIQISNLQRLARKIKYSFVRNVLGKKEESWIGKKLPVRRIPDLSEKYIRDADITIATSNQTADWVKDYPSRVGEKVYFIQDYENWSRDIDLVDQTWKYPLHKITISKWLYELGVNHFGQTMRGIVNNGVDQNHFYPEPKLKDAEKPYHILMSYRKSPQKGCDRGLQILSKIKNKYPDCKMIFFGRDEAPKELFDLGQYEFDPSQDKIRELYSKSKIFFLPSFQEGFAMPPTEAMSCQCLVVATRVGGPMDYIVDGQSGLLADPHSQDEIYSKLEFAFDNNDLREKMALTGFANISSYTWDRATKQLEELLLQIKNKS